MKCRIYGTECINAWVCMKRDACCAGDPDVPVTVQVTASGFDAKLAEVENSVVREKNEEIAKLRGELREYRGPWAEDVIDRLTAERDALRGEVEKWRTGQVSLMTAINTLRTELTAARPIVEAAKAWASDPIVDEESARRNHMHLSRLKHAIDAALGGEGKP